MKKVAWALIAMLAMTACLGVSGIKTDKSINKSKYQTVIFINIYCKSDEDFMTYVMKKIEGTNYIKPVHWQRVVRVHQTYIGWASVRYERDGS